MKQTLRILTLLLVVFASSSIVTQAQTLFDDLKDVADVVVAQDGSGDHSTVQGAIDAAPSNSITTYVILIRNGSYYEKIIIPNEKPNLTLIGEDVDKTILWYDDKSIYTKEMNTFTCHSLRVDASDVKIMNVTIDNPARGAQAIALHGNGDRQTFAHCRILGFQDTYYSDMRSRNYFKDCFIEGATDYIFGFGVALFDSCQIHQINGGSVITAASTPEDYDFGFVFRNSSFATPIDGATSFNLGRPWFDYARTVLIDCYESEEVTSGGWSEWSGRESTCYYAEYNCFGPGSDITNRKSFGQQLTANEAADYTIENIFSANNFTNLEDVGTAEAYLTGLGYDYDALLARSPILSELGAEDADILKYFYRWVGHASEPYLDEIVWRADDKWPVKPTEDWVPDIESDEIYLTMRSHVKAFLDSANTVLEEFEILVEGEPLPTFSPEKSNYGINLPDGSTEPAEVSVEGSAYYTIDYPSEVPEYTNITVSPYNRLGGTVYRIYNSLDSAYWDADLISLKIGADEILKEGVYDYDTILPEDIDYVPFVRIISSNPRAKRTLVPATEVPGTTVITVTAPDEETTKVYNVNFKYAVLGFENDGWSDQIKMINPATGNGIIHFNDPVTTALTFELYTTSGKRLKDAYYSSGTISDTLEFDLKDITQGLYIIKLNYNQRSISARLLVN